MRSNREIWMALLVMALCTAAYAGVAATSGAVPAAYNLFGHGMGILGFLLMLMTETLYTLRKRSRLARWGRMSSWLRFHIITGLVGPYLVLLHTSWKFHGLAGVVMAGTVVVVFSGVVGRYIYTAVPRTVEGAELEAADLERQIAAIAVRVNPSLSSEAQLPVLAAAGGAGAGLGRALLRWNDRVRTWRARRLRDPAQRAEVRQMDRLLVRRRALERQAASLASARRVLATWHSIHIPIGVALFVAAFVHAAGALYYATLLK